MKNVVLTSDLHLTSNPRDEYRWEVFPWLAEQCKAKQARHLFILGDLCDAKDNHPSVLVNGVVQALLGLAEAGNLLEIVILRGNHDGLDPEWPYFRFLSELPFIRFIHEPTLLYLNKGVLLVPHSKDTSGWRELAKRSGVDTVLVHATVTGSKSESDVELQGVHEDVFGPTIKKVWAGDIHVPQSIGRWEYVGAPYPIRFGDKFRPRVLWIDGKGKSYPLHFPTISRRMLDLTPPLKFHKVAPGDQVKVRVQLSRSEFGTWHGLKKEIEAWAKSVDVDLVAMELKLPTAVGPLLSAKEVAQHKSPVDLLKDFSAHSKLDAETAKIGASILKELPK